MSVCEMKRQIMILRQGFGKLLFLNADRLRVFSFQRFTMWFCGFPVLLEFQSLQASIKLGTWNIPEHEKIKIIFMKKINK